MFKICNEYYILFNHLAIVLNLTYLLEYMISL